MKAARMYRWRGAVVVMLLLWAFPVAAQAFSSGSTGADGVFNPPTTVPPGTVINGSTVTVPLPPSGIFNFTTVTIPSGTIVKFVPNATNTPVTMLATSDVTIAGTISVDGANGVAASANPGIQP